MTKRTKTTLELVLFLGVTIAGYIWLIFSIPGVSK
jgi:hypothetical protein